MTFLLFKAFSKSKSESRGDKKRKLIDLIKGKKSTAKSASSEMSITAKSKEKERQISIGWLHFDTSATRYINVRANKGGGTRYITAPASITRDEILSQMQRYVIFQMGILLMGIYPQWQLIWGILNVKLLTF